MNKRRFKILAIAILLICGLGYGISAMIALRAESLTLGMIRSAGFPLQSLPGAKKSHGGLRYENISLDDKNFSAIRSLEIDYNAFALLFGGHPKSISIDGLSLTGDIDKTGKLSIAGWQPTTLSLQKLGKFSRDVQITNSGLAILTDVFGGLSVSFDMQGRTRSDQFDFQLAIKSHQKNLDLLAGANGSVQAGGTWQSVFEIEQGRINAGPFRATRLNGRLTLSGAADSPLKILSEFRAGGMSFYGFPWQDIAGTIEGDPQKQWLFMEGRSIGVEGMDLNLTAKKNPESLNIAGIIHAPKVGDFLDYLAQNNAMLIEANTASKLRELKDTDIDFFIYEAADQNGLKLKYNISNAEKRIGVKEIIDLENPN
jgi:hypothetical protein